MFDIVISALGVLVWIKNRNPFSGRKAVIAYAVKDVGD